MLQRPDVQYNFEHYIELSSEYSTALTEIHAVSEKVDNVNGSPAGTKDDNHCYQHPVRPLRPRLFLQSLLSRSETPDTIKSFVNQTEND